MGLIGSIFGGLVGFSVGGPVGGILGAVVGHHLQGRADRVGADPRQQAQAVFFISTFSMLAKLAKADGHVSQHEIDLVRSFMQDELQLSPEDQRHAIGIFRAAKDSDDSFADFAEQFAGVFAGERRMRETMLALLVRLAAVDGSVHPRERALLDQAARIFSLGEDAVDTFLGTSAGGVARAYAVLGVPPEADDEEIKSRYRKLVTEYHPDKIIAKGLPEEFVELAHKRFQEIQGAWEEIRQARGLR